MEMIVTGMVQNGLCGVNRAVLKFQRNLAKIWGQSFFCQERERSR